MVVSAERWSVGCRVGGRVSEQAGEGSLLGGCGDGQTTWGFEGAITCDLLPDMGALCLGFWAGVSDWSSLGHTHVGGMRTEDIFFGSIMGERVPKREGLNPGHCPVLTFIIFFIRTYQRLSSLKKISLRCGLEGSLKSTSF